MCDTLAFEREVVRLLEPRFAMHSVNIAKVAREITPILIEQILIAHEERSQACCHDNTPLITAINIVIRCALCRLDTICFLLMKYSQIENKTLNAQQETLGDIEDFILCQETPFEERIKETLERVYIENNYLFSKSLDSEETLRDYIEPFRKLFSGFVTKSAVS